MKRSFIILTVMSLVAVSCGSSGQYAGALFQDGIYESSVPASDLALLPNAAGTQFNDQLELEYDDKKMPDGLAIIVGTPVSVEKNPVDSVVHLVVEPEHEERAFSLGQARNVKRIRGSVLR